MNNLFFSILHFNYRIFLNTKQQLFIILFLLYINTITQYYFAVNSSCEYFAVNNIIPINGGYVMKLQFDNLRDLLIFNIKYYRYVNNFSQEKL